MVVHKKSRNKTYCVVQMNTEATRIFIETVRPYVHTSMVYKLNIYQGTMNCKFCGTRIAAPIANFNLEIPCCKNKACKKQRNGERGERWAKKLGKQQLNARAKARYHANVEQRRAYAKSLRLKLISDPAYVEKRNAWKRAYRSKRKAAGLRRM